MIVLELAQARDRVAAGKPAARGSGRWWSRSWLGVVPLLSCSALAAGSFQRRPEQVVKLVHQAAQVQGPGGDLAVLAGDGAPRDQRREPPCRPRGRAATPACRRPMSPRSARPA